MSEIITSNLVPFMLVAFRLAGLFLATPLLSSVMIPMRLRPFIVLGLAAAVYPLTPAWHPPETASLVQLVPLVVGEALIGFVIGMIASLPMLAADSCGIIIGQQMGFGLAKVYNPEYDAEVDVLGQMLFFVVFGAFLACGGLEHVFRALVSTFQRVGPGGLSISQAPAQVLVGVATSGLELAMRLSLPVVATILLLVVVFAVISKTMPAINIMSVGFTVKVLAGIAVLTLALPSIAAVAGDETTEALRSVDAWVGSLGPAKGDR
ncbi:MAG: flagellar biosynthetic protein FliR [Phycisphaerales bacterium]|nr:flagellar biosynthetic protein FliR [Planctomycetota bacterium]